MSRTDKDGPYHRRTGLRLLVGGGPPRWFIRFVWTKKDRQAARIACRGPAGEYRRDRVVETIPDTWQHRHGAHLVPGVDGADHDVADDAVTGLVMQGRMVVDVGLAGCASALAEPPVTSTVDSTKHSRAARPTTPGGGWRTAPPSMFAYGGQRRLAQDEGARTGTADGASLASSGMRPKIVTGHGLHAMFAHAFSFPAPEREPAVVTGGCPPSSGRPPRYGYGRPAWRRRGSGGSSPSFR
jgi:hypothetical protein